MAGTGNDMTIEQPIANAATDVPNGPQSARPPLPQGFSDTPPAANATRPPVPQGFSDTPHTPQPPTVLGAPGTRTESQQATDKLFDGMGGQGTISRPQNGAISNALTDAVNWGLNKVGIAPLSKDTSLVDRVENMFRRDIAKDGSMQLVRPEEFFSPTEQESHPMATAIGETAGGMTSPDNVLLIGMTAGLGGTVAARMLAGGFSAQMLRSAYERFPQIKQAWDAGDVNKVEYLFTHAVLDTSLAAAAASHAVKGGTLEGETQVEKVQRVDSEDARAVGGPPPAQAPTPSAPSAPGVPKPNKFKPTTKKVAGVEIPVTAQQAAEQPSMVTNAASKLATPGRAERFQAERTKPAGTSAVLSALSQTAEDKIARHEAIVNGEARPEPISGTDQPGRFTTPDEIWSSMQKSTESTWEKAREASRQETAAWEQQRDAAHQAHRSNIDAHNKLVDEYNQSLSMDDGISPEQPVAFDPEDVPGVPEQPKTFDQLRDAVQAAKDLIATGTAEERTKAKDTDLPKAEKNLDKWFADHEDVVSPEEYSSAKQLYADSSNYRDIANNLRSKLAKGNLSASDIRTLESTVNGKAIRQRGQRGIGTFQRLVGPEVYQNLQDVARVFDPIDKSSPDKMGMFRSWGHWVAEYAIGGVLGSMLHVAGGPLLGIGGKAATEVFMNKLLFDPEFGSVFTRMADAVRDSAQKGRQIPTDLMTNFVAGIKDLADKITSRQEGAAGAKITPRAPGSPVPPKFGRVGLGGSPENVTPNASGESMASQEAINRQASQKAQGIKTYRVDTRSGRAVPVIGPEAVDAQANSYEKIVQVKGDQVTEMDSGRGAKPLDEQKLLQQLGASAVTSSKKRALMESNRTLLTSSRNRARVG